VQSKEATHAIPSPVLVLAPEVLATLTRTFPPPMSSPTPAPPSDNASVQIQTRLDLWLRCSAALLISSLLSKELASTAG